MQHLANKAHQWDVRALKAEADFCSLHLSDTVFFPGMRRLPYPAQQLVLGQMQRGNELLAEGADPQPLEDELEYGCLFFRQYHLLCAHIWHQEHLFGGFLEDEKVWDDYTFMFKDCGFEIYEGIEVTYSAKELGEELGAPARRRLQVSLPPIYTTLLTCCRFGKSSTPSFSATTDLKMWLRSSQNRQEARFLRGGLHIWAKSRGP